MSRVLVCGGRDFIDVPTIWRALDAFDASLPEPSIRVVIDGASDDVTGPYCGADYWAHMWALAHDRETIRQHAKWREQGRAAGPIRNKEMLDRHKPDYVIAFPGGKGTANMVREAHAAGVAVYKVESGVLVKHAPERP